MEREINFPIKYAVLELKEKGGWAVGYKDIIRGYIVSKCYVMESSISYKSDGTNKITHKVVFPYKNLETLEISIKNGEYYLGKAELPRYDAYNNPYPVNIVDSLFDTFEEAKIIANEKNEELEANILWAIPTLGNNNSLYETKKNEFKDKLRLCDLFEQLLLEIAEDMSITEDISLDTKQPIKILKPVKK